MRTKLPQWSSCSSRFSITFCIRAVTSKGPSRRSRTKKQRSKKVNDSIHVFLIAPLFQCFLCDSTQRGDGEERELHEQQTWLITYLRCSVILYTDRGASEEEVPNCSASTAYTEWGAPRQRAAWKNVEHALASLSNTEKKLMGVFDRLEKAGFISSYSITGGGRRQQTLQCIISGFTACHATPIIEWKYK